ncbi:hypothetical protein ACFSJU_19185 [Paradesertivirga mongoliensis]|uniref:DoxX family protein n=1 Tax=Paradesertivirga mongoliensis TaxID=2100740 RepID=A0ABW4ZR75_9SPHI|nr:hypothetical protein [Pedobacter mongoliensis]
MTKLKICGRVFFGLGVSGIAILHFFFNGFRPVIMPVSPESVAGFTIFVYVIAIYLLVSGILICLGRHVRQSSLMLAAVFFIFLLVGHLPVRLLDQPEVRATWIDAIKLLALSGGALIVASASQDAKRNNFFDALNKLTPAGKFFFAFMLGIFGYGHLAGAQKVSGMVPKYIPWALMWTYISGIALGGFSIALLINFKTKLVGILLGITLFLWLIMLHIYYAIRFPLFKEGENITGAFVCLAFCGIALVIAAAAAKKEKDKQQNYFD